MAYEIFSSDSEKMILTCKSSTRVSIIIFVVGSIFVGVGIGANVLMPSWEFQFVLIKTLFPLFGLLAIYGAISMPKQMRLSQPRRIIFDHSQGAIIVEMNDNRDQKGYIRYDEVEGFDIYEERRTSSGSSNTSNRTYYSYHVFLKKKDGGEWHLFQFNSRAKAEELIIQLKAEIPLDKPFTITEQPKLTSKIQKQDGIDKTIIHWQNKVTWTGSLALFAFALIFLSVLFGFFAFGQNVEVFGSIVIGFIFVVFLFIMTVTIRRLIKEATTRYAVSVDHANLNYYEFSKSTGAMRNNKTMPLSNVKSINYTFSPTINHRNAGLKILTTEDHNREKSYKEKPFEAIKDLFTGNPTLTLSITALNPVECLQLENWLQELILNKGKVKVQ